MTSHLDLVIALNDKYQIFKPGASDEQRLELTRMAAATLNARHADGLRWGLKEKSGQPGVFSADILATETPYEAVDISNGTQGNAPGWDFVTNGWPNGRFVYVEPHDYLAQEPAPGTPSTPPQEQPSEDPDVLGELGAAFTVLLSTIRDIRTDIAALTAAVQKAAADVKAGVKLRF